MGVHWVPPGRKPEVFVNWKVVRMLVLLLSAVVTWQLIFQASPWMELEGRIELGVMLWFGWWLLLWGNEQLNEREAKRKRRKRVLKQMEGWRQPSNDTAA